MSACFQKFYLAGIQTQVVKPLITMLLGMVILCYANQSMAAQQQSHRIEVYALTQNYCDTRPGDTLDEIVTSLLPNNPARRESLKRDIVRLNPKAFIDENPSQLLANRRLWMPAYMKQADSKADPSTTIVEQYSWGNIKRPRE